MSRLGSLIVLAGVALGTLLGLYGTMHTDGGQFFGLIYGGTIGGIMGIVVSLGLALREMRFERRRFEGLFLLIFFSAGLALLVALYDQIGPTVWLYAIVAGLFLIGFVGATIDEIQFRGRRIGRTKIG
jgi:phosphoglycerol transferase MdoB-like AlkP superfamily enzyme